LVTIDVNENRTIIHTDGDLTVYIDLVGGGLYTELPSDYYPEPVSAYPRTAPDLPEHGWVWYDESETTDASPNRK
jgi:hypothetical protein